MKPFEHQIEYAERGYKILQEQGLVYLAMEERTGKTLTSILIVEKLGDEVENVLVVTKKNAIGGWADTLKKFGHNKKFRVINYESLHKIDLGADVYILDEAHRLGTYPKPNLAHKQLKPFTRGKPIIYLSATPSPESYSQLYHQLSLYRSRFQNFYEWYRLFGAPEYVWVGPRQIVSYKKTKAGLIEELILKHVFLSLSRDQIGFTQSPTDKVHAIDFKDTNGYYKELKKHRTIEALSYIADSAAKFYKGLHQLEGGTLKISETRNVYTGDLSKVNYIKENFDTKNIAIFYEYRAERVLLAEHFPGVEIYQSSAFAEGVDLSHIETLIVYSMSWSAGKYVQRRARQCHLNRTSPIEVHFLLIKGSVSQDVYECVTKTKRNFTTNYYLSKV